MKNLTESILAGLMALGLSSGAAASSYQCESGPLSTWKSKDEAVALLVAAGYEVRQVKVNDGCYELYTKRDGKRLEVFVNPVTLEIVKIKVN